MNILDDADEVLSRVPAHFLKAADPTRKERMLLLSNQLARRLQNTVREAEEEAVSSILSGTFEEVGLRSRIEENIARVGRRLNRQLSEIVFSFNEDIVRKTKRVVGKPLHVNDTFSADDKRFVDWVSSSQGKFLQSGYKRMGDILAASIVEQARLKNWSRREVSEHLADQFRARSVAYSEVVASVATMRARSWGQLSTFMEAGVAQWQFHAIMDGLTCFPATTPILMASGRKKPISKIEMGDDVMSCFGRSRKVIRVGSSWTKRWMRLVTKDGVEVHPTYSHLFLTDKGWMRAEKLRVGDRVAKYVTGTKHGAAPTLWSTERDWLGRLGRMDPRVINVGPWPTAQLHKVGEFSEVAEVELLWQHGENYDFEVHEDHGYTVGGMIVHNSEGCMFLHGDVFSVPNSYGQLVRAFDSDDEDDVRNNLPFLQKAITEDGEQFLYFKKGEERTRVATFKNGGFRRDLSTSELEAAGVPVPPLHPHCRSEVLPVL